MLVFHGKNVILHICGFSKKARVLRSRGGLALWPLRRGLSLNLDDNVDISRFPSLLAYIRMNISLH